MFKVNAEFRRNQFERRFFLCQEAAGWKRPYEGLGCRTACGAQFLLFDIRNCPQRHWPHDRGNNSYADIQKFRSDFLFCRIVGERRPG
ncbi:MAG: hypothetical protein BWX73_01912 [Lentisphaerae bacterium ADurb.Bin082]|nr:MAG: hypothetical protein BWX73_01912 [Lentisphaerae bacterium ADurb.Bin082]